jgi:hypothetical protein
MTELQDVPAIMLVNGLADGPPERDVSIVIDHRVVGDDAAAQMHRDKGRDDRPDASFGELHLPVDPGLVSRAVVVIETARHIRTEDAVLDGQVAELEGLKNWFESHVDLRAFRRAMLTIPSTRSRRSS